MSGGTDQRIGMGDEVAHSFEERPWGSWHVLDEGEGYKLKRLEVKPGKRLSYQTHTYRAELWIIVAGLRPAWWRAATIVAHTGDCVEIGLGVAHRITNLHETDLVIVELQRGPYTGEDDIVRLEDDLRADSRSPARRVVRRTPNPPFGCLQTRPSWFILDKVKCQHFLRPSPRLSLRPSSGGCS